MALLLAFAGVADPQPADRAPFDPSRAMYEATSTIEEAHSLTPVDTIVVLYCGTPCPEVAARLSKAHRRVIVDPSSFDDLTSAADAERSEASVLVVGPLDATESQHRLEVTLISKELLRTYQFISAQAGGRSFWLSPKRVQRGCFADDLDDPPALQSRP